MGREHCPHMGRECLGRVTLDEKYPICKRILGQLTGSIQDKSHLYRKCQKHVCGVIGRDQCTVEMAWCGCFGPDEDYRDDWDLPKVPLLD